MNIKDKLIIALLLLIIDKLADVPGVCLYDDDKDLMKEALKVIK